MKKMIKCLKRMIRFSPQNLKWILTQYTSLKTECREKYNIVNIKPFKIYDWHAGFIYFKGELGTIPVFMKACIGQYNTISAEKEMAMFNDLCWHPFVVGVLEGDIPTIITEFIQNTIRVDDVPEEEVPRIVEQAVRILGDLRENHIFHRDIRPENLFVTSNYQLILHDFGWAIYEEKIQWVDDFIEKILNINYRKNSLEFDDAYSMLLSLKEMFPNEQEDVFEPVKREIGIHVLKRKGAI